MRVAGGCDCFGRFTACLVFVFLGDAVVEWMLFKEGSGPGQMRCVSNLTMPALERGHGQFIDISHVRRMVGADNLRR